MKKELDTYCKCHRSVVRYAIFLKDNHPIDVIVQLEEGYCEDNLDYVRLYFRARCAPIEVRFTTNYNEFKKLDQECMKLCDKVESYLRQPTHEEFLEELKKHRDDEYIPRAGRDYGPSNPWDAPGMSMSDFI